MNKKKYNYKVIFLTATSILITFIPFFGYTYLVGKMEAAGFESVSLDPKLYDLVFYAFEAFAAPMNDFVLSIDAIYIVDLIYRAIKISLIVGVVLGFFIILISYIGRKNYFDYEKTGDQKYLIKVIDILKNSSVSFKKSIVAITISIGALFLTVILEFVVFILFFTLLCMFWLIGVTGYIIGLSEGERISINDVCIHQENLKDNKKRMIKCSELTTIEKKYVGNRIYQDDKYTYFLTNEGAFQFENKNIQGYYKPRSKKEQIK